MSRSLASNDSLIKEFLQDSNYRVERDGSVFTLKNGAGRVTSNWRQTASIQKGGYVSLWYKYKHIAVHRIVYAKFIGELDENLTVNHKDGNPGNNAVDNLELITQAANNLHRYRILGKPGVKGNSIINFTTAESIRLLKNKYGVSHNDLMKIFKVTKSAVSAIVNGKIWKTE